MKTTRNLSATEPGFRPKWFAKLFFAMISVKVWVFLPHPKPPAGRDRHSPAVGGAFIDLNDAVLIKTRYLIIKMNSKCFAKLIWYAS